MTPVEEAYIRRYGCMNEPGVRCFYCVYNPRNWQFPISLPRLHEQAVLPTLPRTSL